MLMPPAMLSMAPPVVVVSDDSTEKEKKAVEDAAAWRAEQLKSFDLGGLSKRLVMQMLFHRLVAKGGQMRSFQAPPLLAMTKCVMARLPSAEDGPRIPDGLLTAATQLELPVCLWTDLPASKLEEMRSKTGLDSANVLVAPSPGGDYTAFTSSVTWEPKVYVVTGAPTLEIYELVLCLQKKLGPCAYLASTDDEIMAMVCAAAGIAAMDSSDTIKALSCVSVFMGPDSVFNMIREVRNARDEPAKFLGGGNACKGRAMMCYSASMSCCCLYVCCCACPCHPCNPDRRARQQMAALQALTQTPQVIGQSTAV